MSYQSAKEKQMKGSILFSLLSTLLLSFPALLPLLIMFIEHTLCALDNARGGNLVVTAPPPVLQ